MYSEENDGATSVAVLTVLAILSVLGLATNAFLLYMLKRVPETSTSFQLIRVIGLVDLLICVFTLAVIVARLALGPVEAFTSWFYCPVLSSATFFLCGVSGILMGLLALERYSVICYQRGLSRAALWTLVAVGGFVATVLIVGNSSLGSFGPGASYTFCVPDGTRWSRNFSIGFDVLFDLPLVVLFVCYSGIIVRCYRAHVPDHAESITRTASLRALFFMFVYFLCYFPKFSTSIISFYSGPRAPPVILYVLIPVGMTLLVLVNPVLVLLMHRRIKVVVLNSLSTAKDGYSIQLA